MAKYYKVFFMPKNQNPNDLNVPDHKMITRSKRKRNKKSNDIYYINDNTNRTLKKMKNDNILFQLGAEWDSEKEDNDNNQVDFEEKQINTNNNEYNNYLTTESEGGYTEIEDESDNNEELCNEELSDENSEDETNLSLNIKKKINKKKIKYYEDDESIFDKKITDEEREIGNLLAGYINKNIDKIKYKEEKSKTKKILKKYSNDMRKYFFELGENKQLELLEIENKINLINNNTLPLRFQILNADLDINIKATAIKKIEALSNLEPSTTEYYKISNWVDGLLKLPFGKYKELPVSKSNTPFEINNYFKNCNKILDEAVYGHKKAKTQILQIVGQWISNPNSKGSVFSIVGPMGNGKTTLVKEGIAKMINRPFEFVSLGGATDSSFLDGHSYTYEGSIPGKIVDILKKSQYMNPVIYFDELDKVSNTPKGEEIINLLIHLTDFSQNGHFMDKYYSDVPLDLSRALFIFSLNNIEKVNPILRDRMYMIQTDKLTNDDKIRISKNYMIPKIIKEICLNDDDVYFDDDIIKYIISSHSQEEGVRKLKRAYETILSKINLIKITYGDKNESNVNEDDESLFSFLNYKNIKFPLKLNRDIIDKLIDDKNKSNIPLMMYS